MALDAGYSVRCLMADDPREQKLGGTSNGAKGRDSDQYDWNAIQDGLQDTKQLQRVLKAADFVVVMLNDLLPGTKKGDYPCGVLLDFCARLYPLMRRQSSIQVFLYQVRMVWHLKNSRFIFTPHSLAFHLLLQ